MYVDVAKPRLAQVMTLPIMSLYLTGGSAHDKPPLSQACWTWLPSAVLCAVGSVVVVENCSKSHCFSIPVFHSDIRANIHASRPSLSLITLVVFSPRPNKIARSSTRKRKSTSSQLLHACKAMASRTSATTMSSMRSERRRRRAIPKPRSGC